jgi:hypothetical protein
MASNKKLPIKGNLTRKQIAENLIKARKNTPVPAKKRTTKEITGKAAIDVYQKEISPRGMAKTKAKQTAALDKLMEKRYGKKK